MKLTEAQRRNLVHVRDHGRPLPRNRAGYSCRIKGLSAFVWLFADGTVATTDEQPPSDENRLIKRAEPPWRNMMDRAELIERLEKLTGPDRLTDLDLLFEFDGERAYICNGLYEPKPVRAEYVGDGFYLFDEKGKRGLWGDHMVPRYTGDFQDAHSLAFTMKPKALWGFERKAEPPFFKASFGEIGRMSTGEHSSEAIALLIALLRSDKE
ncbi:MAG: hypothetical protein KDJ29_17300, partial [Hyphomicrobiales bacterium]|nr:hypothetical protein [Hyphomicrobiales bacterium]